MERDSIFTGMRSTRRNFPIVLGNISLPDCTIAVTKKDGKYQLKVGEATVVLGGKAQELLAGKGVGERKVTVGIRPEHIAFAAAPGTDTVSSKVDVSEMMGSEVYLHVNAVGRDVVLRIPTTDLPAEHRAGIPYGTEINFAFRPDLIHLFDPETEKNLMY